MKQLHWHETQQLTRAIELNSAQIQKRKTALDTYQLMNYNLSEALLVQPEILSPN
ncbi:hypothetical protein [Ulvibacter antarcticus]|nr:hypothetical protein [Ulvibacter antarcticus]